MPQFTLNVTFHGLCLFVRPSPGHPEMFVLFPKTPRPDVPKHDLDIRFNGTPETLKQGEELRFLNLPGNGGPTTLPAGVANLKAGYVRPVHGSHVGPNPNSNLRARALLPDGSLTPGAERDCWRIGTREEAMTDHVLWSATVPDASELRWAVHRFNGSFVRELPPVPATGGEVRIAINHHDPESEPIPRPDPGYEPRHFAAYLALLHQGTGLPLPRLLDECPSLRPPESASLYSCMVAGGEL
ncbi:MAG TPA: hypothetical protein VF092_14720 [Longimicrobium sp.]